MNRIFSLLTLWCVVIYWACPIAAQIAPVDSLENEVAQASGTAKIDLLNQLLKMHLCRANEKALVYHQRILAEPKQEQYAKGTVMRLKSYGTLKYCSGQLDSAIHFYHEALALANTNNLQALAGALHNNLGSMYRFKGDFEKAKFNLKKCIQAGKTLKDTTLIIAATNGLGLIYMNLGILDSALQTYLSAERIATAQGSQTSLVDIKTNITNIYLKHREGNVSKEYILQTLRLAEKTNYLQGQVQAYQHLGAYEFYHKNYDDSFEYLTKGIKINEKVGNAYLQVYLLQGIGNIHFQRKAYEKAIEVNKQGIDIALASKVELTLPLLYANTASNYVELKQYQNAIIYANKTIEVIEKTGQLENGYNCYLYLAKAHEGLGQIGKAYEAFKTYEQKKAEFLEEEKSKQLAEMETKYETAKKESENVILSQKNELQAIEIAQKNQLLFLSVIAFLLIGAAAYFWFQQRAAKSKSNMAELEQRFLRSQLNPHFIFNALSSIQHFMLKNEAKKAGFYLAKFGKLMRQILENSRQEFIPIEEEVKMLENYMDLQNAKSKHHFDYHIQVDEAIDPESFSIPPMFTQPFVENAIEHGISALAHKGKINVSFTKEKEFIRIQVKDNGQGIYQNQAINVSHPKEHHSLATTIIKERIDSYNKALKQKIQLLIEEMNNEHNEVIGTHVELKVPYQLI
ncbi:MAG: tetratricopeptide repeat-containing sensor histidine kinase [Flammeovirgaceae bacterium]